MQMMTRRGHRQANTGQKQGDSACFVGRNRVEGVVHPAIPEKSAPWRERTQWLQQRLVRQQRVR